MSASPRPPSKDWPLAQLPGLSAQDCEKLKACGLETTRQLLQRGSNLADRQQLANQIHLPVRHVTKWVVMADLARVPAVGCQYCGFLLHLGILSVPQLAQTPIHTLQRQAMRLQVAATRQREHCPTVAQMTEWIHQAKQLAQS